MSYTKQNWADKTVVTKSGLINMDNQIAANEEAATSQGTRLTAVEALASSASSTATAANTTATALANGTTAAGNAKKLGNQLPSYFATASSLTQNGYGTESGGRNLIDNGKLTSGYYAKSSNGVLVNVGSGVSVTEPIPVNVAQSYYFSGFRTENSGNSGAMYDSAMNYVGAINNDSDMRPITIPSNVAFVRINIWHSNYSNIKLAQFEEGTSATAYEPYYASNKHLTDRIDRDYELERFGYVCPIINGVKNFVDSNGVLHRRIARVDLTNFEWYAFAWWGSDHTFQASFSSAESTSAEVYLQGYDSDDTLDFSNAILSGTVKGVGIRVLDDYTRIIISDSSCTTAEQMKAKLKKKYLYYELATEETYSAYDTPSVQSMISDEWQSGASNSYTVGTYRIWQNRLYRCKTQTDGTSGSPDVDTSHWVECNISSEFVPKGNYELTMSMEIPTSYVSGSVLSINDLDSFLLNRFQANTKLILHSANGTEKTLLGSISSSNYWTFIVFSWTGSIQVWRKTSGGGLSISTLTMA